MVLVTLAVSGSAPKRTVLMVLTMLGLFHGLYAACSNSVTIKITTPVGWTKSGSGKLVVFSKPPSYTCTCENGQAATGTDCTQNGATCSSCSTGYEKQGVSCTGRPSFCLLSVCSRSLAEASSLVATGRDCIRHLVRDSCVG